jgi:hypothetical protein
MWIIAYTLLGGLLGAVFGVGVVYRRFMRENGDTFFSACYALSCGLRPGIVGGAILGFILSLLHL